MRLIDRFSTRALPEPTDAPWGVILGQTYLAGDAEQILPTFVSYATEGYAANGVVFSVILARLTLFSEAEFKFRDLTTKRLFGTPTSASSKTRGQAAPPASSSRAWNKTPPSQATRSSRARRPAVPATTGLGRHHPHPQSRLGWLRLHRSRRLPALPRRSHRRHHRVPHPEKSRTGHRSPTRSPSSAECPGCPQSSAKSTPTRP